MKVHLYELDAYHLASGHIHRWHLATAPGYRSRTDDTPAAVTWLPLVGQWASVAVRAAGERGSGSQAQIDDLRLINVRASDDLPRWASVYDVTAGVWLRVELGDRPLNPLLIGYVVRRIVEKEVDTADSYAAASTIWQAKAGIIQLDRTELRLPIFDRQLDFDTPVQVEKYAGTGGLEGPAELKDATKERCFGWHPIVVPTYLGIIGGKHTYSVNGGHPIEAIVRGWDKGSTLTLVSGTPSAGQFSADLATGILTIGGSRPEDFRVEVKGDKSGGVWRRYIGEVIGYLATTHGGIIGAANVAGMDATPRTVGVYLPTGDTTTHRDLYGKLTGSVARGHWYIDLTDTLVVGRLPAASSVTPERAYRRAAGSTPGLKPVPDGQVTPAKQVIIRYAENPSATDQTAGATTADIVALWSKQWREVASETDATIAAAWGASARVEYIETALTVASEAAAEAPLWLAELSNPPQSYELQVRDGAPGLWIGEGVSVTDDIAGFETGATVVVSGRTNRDRGGGATLYVQR